MKKLLKSEICGSVNRAWNPHVAENWLKSQTFRLKKKKKKHKRKRASGKRKTHFPNAPLVSSTKYKADPIIQIDSLGLHFA